MNVGVIGTGTMGRNHARIYSELKGIEETYVFDVNKTNYNDITNFGAVACDSMDELLDNVDAVSICVPTKYHLQVAKEVIEKDIHCLIEKPIAQSVSEAEELVDL
jgi:predicted dehydrogenase